MAITKYLLAALTVAASVAAQCSVSTTTVTASADAAGIAGCSTYTGSISIATDAAGAISLDGIKVITGNLTVQNNPAISSLEANDLETIGGFSLGNLTILSALTFPNINKVTSLNFTALPGLQYLTFGSTGITEASSVLITNTQLNTLEGLNLNSLDTININNNLFLRNVSLQLTSLSGSLDIEANGRNLDASFPNLQTAQNMTFRNCSTVELPALANVTQDLGLYGNYFTTFSAPNLTTVGGMILDDNTSLTNISIPLLTSVNGTYQIANNTLLKSIDGFPKLASITGSVDINGNLTNCSLPALSDVQGAFNLSSTTTFDCSAFDKDNSNQVIKGTYVCSGSSSSSSGTPSSTASSTSSGSTPKSTTKSGAAGHLEINIPAVIVGTTVIAGLLQLLL